MTIGQLHCILSETGIPFAYHHWNEKKRVPYGVFWAPYSNNMAADGVAYCEINHWQIELYTDGKDPDAEALVSAALAKNGLFFDRSESWLEDIKKYQTIFELEV